MNRIGKSFTELHRIDDLQPGDIFETKDQKEQILIGDVNTAGGVCDDCIHANGKDFFLIKNIHPKEGKWYENAC